MTHRVVAFCIHLALCAVLAGCSAARHRVPGVESVHAGVDRLSWLVGVWEPRAGTGATEVWAQAEDGVLRGFSLAMKGGAVEDYELLAIEPAGRSVVYLARPNGLTPSSAFALVELDGTRAVFANPAHDFPQRVGYEREGNVLSAWIEGPGSEGVKRIAWTWTRR
ncbi:MAG: hypothetical protein KJZ65_06325 [Phycisphaerales bacterium]|nr:hypothetical protein [Phycisphaerales bacterium]